MAGAHQPQDCGSGVSDGGWGTSVVSTFMKYEKDFGFSSERDGGRWRLSNGEVVSSVMFYKIPLAAL